MNYKKISPEVELIVKELSIDMSISCLSVPSTQTKVTYYSDTVDLHVFVFNISLISYIVLNLMLGFRVGSYIYILFTNANLYIYIYIYI